MNTFDLIDRQQTVREIFCPKRLFETWETVSRKYLMLEVTKYDLEEMQAVVWEQFRLISEAGKRTAALKKKEIGRVNPRAALSATKATLKVTKNCACGVCLVTWKPKRGNVA